MTLNKFAAARADELAAPALCSIAREPARAARADEQRVNGRRIV